MDSSVRDEAGGCAEPSATQRAIGAKPAPAHAFFSLGVGPAGQFSQVDLVFVQLVSSLAAWAAS